MKWTNANTLCRDLQRGDASPEEVMAEVYDRIEAVNSSVNALVSLLPREVAMAMAKQADQVPVAERGPLHGLPMANKDMVEVEGFATTWGFVPWAERIAKKDDGFAARMRTAGALFIGRSNMPEFGLGSNTFNSLYGATLNPYDPTKTPGGSSGGAAVALATGMLPLADGSDMGGSLRNPASFCNVVGFRPSIGRMPFSRGFGWMGRLSTTGPMARTVADTTLLFSVQAGPDATDPLTLPEPGHHFLDGLVPFENLNDLRVAYAPTLHGLPIDPEVMTVMQTAADVFSDLGAEVVSKSPPLEQAMDVFHTQRAAGLVAIGDTLDRTVPNWREFAKDTAIWNIEKGKALSADEIIQAELTRTQIYAETVRFFEDFDAIILPSAQVAPFSHELEYVQEINGVKLDSYIDWMTICCAITVTGCPAISVPAGFTPGGLPVGLQIVGKPRGDLALLRIAHAFEAATEHYLTKPAISAV
ncbi:MAG: amidase [Candidatus Azotimanducaceae bacterium]|jgi:amidase